MSKHQTRRIMSPRDFSHAEPSIFVEKDKMTRLAKKLKKRTGRKHSECLVLIANIFCGAQRSFGEYWQQGIYDLTLADCAALHPDVLRSRIPAFAELFECSEFIGASMLLGDPGARRLGYSPRRPPDTKKPGA